MKVFWDIQNSGLYPHERCTILKILGKGRKPREFKNPTDASLQRIIKLSAYRIDAEVLDDTLTVSGVIEVMK